jgi:hypothetical protein
MVTYGLHLLLDLGLVLADIAEGHAVPLVDPAEDLLVQAKEDVRLHLMRNSMSIRRSVGIEKYLGLGAYPHHEVLDLVLKAPPKTSLSFITLRSK